MKKIAVVIVNYETPELIDRLVRQFSIMDSDLFDLDIIDNSQVYKTPHATIRYGKNIGFDQAISLWLQNKKEKGYAGYWILNSDITLNPDQDYIRNFLNLLEYDNTIGLIGTKVRTPENHGIPQEVVADGDVWEAQYVDFQSAVISRTLLEKFDFSYIPYFHGGLDFDFNFCAVKNKMSILIDGRLSVYHDLGVSLKLLKNTDLEDHFESHDIAFPFETDKFGYLLVLGLKRKYPEIQTIGEAITQKQILFKSSLISYTEKCYKLGMSYSLNLGLPYLERAVVAGSADAEGAYLTACVEHGLYNQYVDLCKKLKFKNSNVTANNDFMRAQNTHYINVKAPIKTIVFYVKPGPGHAWDPGHTEEGIGGSEIAVIQLSKELVKLGHKVYVFNFCKEVGVYDGVVWKTIEEFDSFEKSNFIDVLVVSRWPEFRFVNPKTRVYFWAHDLNYFDRINATNWQYFDKFLILSKYHYRFFSCAYPFIPAANYEIMSNGLDLGRFDQVVKRNPKKLIYSSNPDRGLIVLIDIFEELHKWDPELELHVFGYYPDNIRKLPTYWRDTPGLIYRGYADQKELAMEYMSSKLWLYPCTWLETFCITAIEAQAAGTPSVVSDWGCLRERVGNAGIVVDGLIKDEDHKKRFGDAVKLLLTDEKLWLDLSVAGKKQAENFSWKQTAEHFVKVCNANYTNRT